MLWRSATCQTSHFHLIYPHTFKWLYKAKGVCCRKETHNNIYFSVMSVITYPLAAFVHIISCVFALRVENQLFPAALSHRALICPHVLSPSALSPPTSLSHSVSVCLLCCALKKQLTPPPPHGVSDLYYSPNSSSFFTIYFSPSFRLVTFSPRLSHQDARVLALRKRWHRNRDKHHQRFFTVPGGV